MGVTVAPTRRMTLVEAADILGISKEAVRKRVKRGSLSSDKGADGRVYVYLDTGGDTTQDKGTADLSPPSDALLSEMRDRIAFLEQEMEAWREESRRKDTIIMNMTEAMKAISPPTAEEPTEAQESPETPSDTAPKTPGPPEPVTPRVVASSVSHSRLGMSARVLVLGAIVTFLASAFFWFLRGDERLPDLWVVVGPLGTLLLFGLCAGYTKRPSLRWFSWPHRWMRRSGRSVLEIALFVAGIPATAGLLAGGYYISGRGVIGGVQVFLAYFLRDPLTFLLYIIIFVGIAAQAFMSGAFLGNASRRFGVLGTQKEPLQGEDEGEQEEEVWSPRKEAQWGLAGSIIVALISALASVVAGILS